MLSYENLFIYESIPTKAIPTAIMATPVQALTDNSSLSANQPNKVPMKISQKTYE